MAFNFKEPDKAKIGNILTRSEVITQDKKTARIYGLTGRSERISESSTALKLFFLANNCVVFSQETLQCLNYH